MTNDNAENPTDGDVRSQLAEESGSIGWSELMRHFARGVVIRVDPSVELIDAAVCFVNDDTEQLSLWLTENTVAKASDDDARGWNDRQPQFQCVVVAPWVLVQEAGEPVRTEVLH